MGAALRGWVHSPCGRCGRPAVSPCPASPARPGPARRARGAARSPAASPAGGAALPARPGPELPALPHYRFRLPQEVSPWEPRPQRGERGRPPAPRRRHRPGGHRRQLRPAAASPSLAPSASTSVIPFPSASLIPISIPFIPISICIHIRDAICISVSIPVPVPVSIRVYIRDHISICVRVPIPASIPSTALLPWGQHPIIPPPCSLGSLKGFLPAIVSPQGRGVQGQGDTSRASTRCHHPVPLALVTEGLGLAPGPAFGEGCLCCACQQNLAERSSGRAAWSHQTDA